MKTCARCGRTYPSDQTLCPQCGLMLPGLRGLAGVAQAHPAVSHIDFLLQQLEEWVRQGWVAPEQARQLYDIYQERRQRLLTGPPADSLPPFPPPRQEQSTPLPPLSETQPAPPPARRASPLAAFFEESNLSFWQLIGALLLLAGLVGLVRWTWGSVGKYLVFALMLGLTGGLYALARSRFVREERLTRSALLAIAALLVPLDIVAVNAFRLLGGAWETNGIGLLTSLLCLPLYGWLSRREAGRWPAVLTAADAAVAVYFSVHGALQVLGLTSTSEMRDLAYGGAYSCLALGALLAAWREQESRRDIWLKTAYTSTLVALAFAVWAGGSRSLGSLAATLLLLGLAYGVAAALFEDRTFAWLSLAGGVTGGVLALHRAGLGDWIAVWYLYVVWFQAVALASWGVGMLLSRRGREILADACRDSGLFLAGLAVTAQAVRAVIALGDYPTLRLPNSEIGGMLLCAALSLGFFFLARFPLAVSGLLAYLTVLLGLLAAHDAPAYSLWHDQTNLGLFLGVAALILWRLHHQRVSLIVGALGLLACGVYASSHVFWETTAVALPLLVFLFAAQTKTAGALSLWPAAAASVLEVLLLEQRVLPWMQRHLHGEPNYGFGLFLLSLLGLALGERLRSRDWMWAALTVGTATAVMQVGYALTANLPYSPLALLGAIFAAMIGLVQRLPRAADCAVGLTAGFCLAFVLGQFSANATAAEFGRETLAAGGLLVLALLLAWLAVRQERPALVYAAVLAGATSEVLGLHRFWHPVPAVYALALWPLVAALYAVGMRLARRAEDYWRQPLDTSALFLSFTALLTATLTTLVTAGRAGETTLIETVCLYGVLYAVVAVGMQRASDAGLSAVAFSGAYLLALFHHMPPLHSPALGFAFSLMSLFWLGAALGTARLAQSRFAARSLHASAIAVGMIAIVIALTGLGSSSDRDIVYTLLVAGTALLGASWGLEMPAWGHAGVAAYFLAYFAYLTKSLGMPGLPNSDFYLIPAGCYILALGLLARRAHRPQSPSYFLTGLLLVLTPTFIAAWQPHSAPLHALLLLTECVAAVFYGIAARVKVFVGAGLGFLIALLLRETQGLVGHIHWAIYATGLGLAILASALYFEKRGDEVRRWARTAQEKLQEWD